jgi:hypothetical protein
MEKAAHPARPLLMVCDVAGASAPRALRCAHDAGFSIGVPVSGGEADA